MTNLKPKKSLGQNFLRDENVLNKIINSVEVKEDDLIIEIGPGEGDLTKKLQKLNANLVCFEIDERLKPRLESLVNEKTKIIFTDFLKVNLDEELKDYKYRNMYVIANIPYYITTPIIEKITNSKIPVTQMVLMVQDEVADRFTARPKTKSYGSISVFLNYYYDLKKLFIVKNTSFYPIPKIDSAVISLTIKEKSLRARNEQLFFKLIKDSFKQKRKTLKNNLIGYDLNKVEKILLKNDLSLQCRAEEISLDVFVEIADTLI